jgi:hypothetical protein
VHAERALAGAAGRHLRRSLLDHLTVAVR